MSIKRQIGSVLGALLVGMLGIFLYSFLNFLNLQENMVIENQQLLTKQLATSVSGDCQQIDKLVKSVAYNQMVQAYLVEPNALKKFEAYQNVADLLNNTKSINGNVIDIAVVSADGMSVNLEGSAELAKSLLSKLPETGDLYYFGLEQYHISNQWRPCIVAGMWIYSLDPGTYGMKRLGAVFCAIDPVQLLNAPVDSSDIAFDVLFWDRENRLLSGDETLFKGLMESGMESLEIQAGGKSYLTLTQRVEEMGGGVTTLVSVESRRSKILSAMVRQYILMAAAVLLVAVVLLVGVKRVFSSINELTGLMHRIQSGNRTALKERLPVSGGSLEADSAAEAFNGMLDEIDKLNHDVFRSYTRMYEMEMASKLTELVYLRSQINPHFLYNTLELICGLSLGGGQRQEIVEVTRALGGILRYSIRGGGLVALHQEVEVTRSYLMIQLKRFGDRFQVEYDFPAEVSEAQVPKMLLQPLVENAIYHGLEERLEPGVLRLRAQISKDGALLLFVEDDGMGIAPEVLQQLQTRLETGGRNDSPESGIGLSNVHSRVQLYYGKEYGLQIESALNQGTRIIVRLPFQDGRNGNPIPPDLGGKDRDGDV